MKETLKTFIKYKSEKIKIKEYIKKKDYTKGLLLRGQYGIGKTTLVKLIIKKYDMELIDIDIYEKGIENKISKLSSSYGIKSFFGKDKIILVDNIDDNVNVKIIRDITKLIEVVAYPLIVIATNKYCRNIDLLNKYCTVIKFKKLQMRSITPIISERYKELNPEVVKKYISPDIRQTFIKLDFARLEKSDITMDGDPFSNTFQSIDNILSGKTFSPPYDSLLPLLIGENYLKYTNDINIASDSINSICEANTIAYDFNPSYMILSCTKPCMYLHKKFVRTSYPKKSLPKSNNNYLYQDYIKIIESGEQKEQKKDLKIVEKKERTPVQKKDLKIVEQEMQKKDLKIVKKKEQKKDLKNKTVKQLRDMCKKNDLNGYSKYRKKELIDFIILNNIYDKH